MRLSFFVGSVSRLSFFVETRSIASLQAASIKIPENLWFSTYASRLQYNEILGYWDNVMKGSRDAMRETRCERRDARDAMRETRCERREASRLYKLTNKYRVLIL